MVDRVRGGLGRRSADTTIRVGAPVDVAGLAVLIDGRGPVVGQAIRQRADQVIAVLSGTGDPGSGDARSGDSRSVLDALVRAVTPIDRAKAWLLLATIDGRLPEGTQVETMVRTAELDGIETVVVRAVADRVNTAADDDAWPTVSILVDRHLVDVTHTAVRDVATGIQRVTREVSRRWVQTHGVTLIGWRPDLTAIRELSPPEAHRACWGGPPVRVPVDDPVIVPWHCTYLLPELAIEIDQVPRLQKLAEHSGTTLNIIGHDLVPVTSAETINEAIAPGFARHLSAARYARNIVCVSRAAANEYRGWRVMLAGNGIPGPHIEAAPLPTEVPAADEAVTAAARQRLQVGSLPLVLVVGSHEPRKNHRTVLHAAELLWREGHHFSLSFIGGNSWNSELFLDALAHLRAIGRPVESITAATDELLFGGFRVARFTVFPSLHEGFGLPVAESLACGTPVITSNFGSMKEIADAGGGALLVDPRDDHGIADAMRRLLTDDDLLGQLAEQARSRPIRTWDSYAEQVWGLLNRPASG